MILLRFNLILSRYYKIWKIELDLVWIINITLHLLQTTFISSLPLSPPTIIRHLSLYLQIFKTCSSFKALKVIHGGCKLKGIQRSFVLVLFIIFLTIIFTRISTLALC
ncbi:hypothetical protein HanPI659440_Chr10g0368661 [Helianthus annuus]|nr:hypothetical protein HanPI659440_Chr10g0368661 [Helianthus annuus]